MRQLDCVNNLRLLQPAVGRVAGRRDPERHPVHYDREVAAFVGAIRTGTPPPAPAEQGLVVMRIIDAVYRSAETGRQIDLSRAGESEQAVA